MSVQAFRALFDNEAFKKWFKEPNLNPETATIFQAGREQLKNFVRASQGDFVISREQLINILGKGTDVDRLLNEAATNQDYLLEGILVRTVNGQTQLFIPDIKYSALNNTVARLLGDIGKSAGVGGVQIKVSDYLKDNEIDIGHVFGFTNTLLNRVKQQAGSRILKEAEQEIKRAKYVGDQKYIQNAEKAYSAAIAQVKALEEFVDALLDLLEDYDIATSDIRGLDLQINSKYRKTSSSWLFEWQGSAANQAAGRAVAGAIGRKGSSKTGGSGLRGFMVSAITNPNNLKTALTGLLQDFANISVNAPNTNKLNILQQKGSPSLIELISDEITSSLTGNPKKYRDIYTGATKLNKTIPLLRIKKSNSIAVAKAQLKSLKTKTKATKSKIKEVSSQKLAAAAKANLASLPNLIDLINAQLTSTIKQNMGTGNRADILNYRTGRFAESVKVEKLSESRQGMITAFYSYMKYPYATFSQGGRQEIPRSRDPKLLISKSIREIAATLVGNRMRAVSL